MNNTTNGLNMTICSDGEQAFILEWRRVGSVGEVSGIQTKNWGLNLTQVDD